VRGLEEIARAAGSLNGKAERVNVAMNNHRGAYPEFDGMQLKEMLLEDWHPRDRKALVQSWMSAARNRGRGSHVRQRRRVAAVRSRVLWYTTRDSF